MKYLLDTVVWLWSVSSVERIADQGREILADGESEIYLSCASSWEIAIKTQAGRCQLPEPPAQYVPKRLAEQGIKALSINQTHALKTYDLPLYHRDPFDRMIISQAMVEGMVILSSDHEFEKYAVELVWCGI